MTPESGHLQCRSLCPLCARSGHSVGLPMRYEVGHRPLTARCHFGRMRPSVFECGEHIMFKMDRTHIAAMLLTVGWLACLCSPAGAAVRIEGQVQAGGGPLASSTVTLWATSAGEPRQLAQTRTRADGRFELRTPETPGRDVVLYLVAKGGQATVNKGSGDNAAIALLTVLGNMPPAKVVINEMTTVASVWTHNQFIDGSAIKGPALSLRIAAGNVPNFVDLATGGWGGRHSGSAQQQPNAHNGQLRHAGRLARRLRHASDG